MIIYVWLYIYIWLYACICIWSPTPMAHHFSPGGGRDNASPWIILKRLARQLALLPMSIQWESWLISPGWSCKKNCVYSLKASETVCLFKRFDEKYTTKMANLCKFAGQKKNIKHHKTMLLTDFRGIFPPADRRSRASSRRPWQTRPSSLRTLFGRQTRGIPGFFFTKELRMTEWLANADGIKWIFIPESDGKTRGFERVWPIPLEVILLKKIVSTAGGELDGYRGFKQCQRGAMLGEMAGSESWIQSWCLHVMTSPRFRHLMCVWCYCLDHM